MYVKLFSTILSSSVWSAPHATRIVWITMLAMADEEGVVRSAESGLAHQARVTIPECRSALKYLSAPDIESQSQEWGGRRIEAIDGGWLILSYTKYREIRTQSQRASAVRQRRFRQKNDDGGDFARAWLLYPKRAGSNSRTLALRAWTARLATGAKPDDLIAGVERYAAFIRATGKERTEYVKQAATFFGPSEHWTEDYTLPVETNGRSKNGSRADVDDALVAELDRNHSAGRRHVRDGAEKLF